jgi:flagellar protein FlgJ
MLDTIASNLSSDIKISSANLARGQKGRMEQSTEDFMSVLISRTIEPMFPQDDEESMIFGGGNGGDIYRTLMVQEFGKILGQNGLLKSLDQSIQKQLLALQESNNG